ncbi:MAG: ABC transporter, ATP-binding protein (cluster 5, nickel/peptides/opines), partial [uncultured Acetobacteraceae bacterium]
ARRPGAEGRVRRSHRGGPRRLAPRQQGRDPLPGGRVRLRQVRDRPRRDEPAGARRQAGRGGLVLRRPGSAAPVGQPHVAAPRRPDGDDLPGADDQPEPRLHRGLADDRGAAPPPRHAAGPGGGPGGRAAGLGRHHRAGDAARPVPAPALRRVAPAGDDRHGADVRPGAAGGGRADHRARRHGAGANPAAAGHAATRPRPRHPAHHARPRRRRARRRPGLRDVRRGGRGERADRRAVRRPAPPLHARAAALRPRPGQDAPRRAAGQHPRRRAPHPARLPGLRLPRPLRARRPELRGRRAAPPGGAGARVPLHPPGRLDPARGRGV